METNGMFSFKITKKTDPKRSFVKIPDVDAEKDKSDFVLSIDSHEIKSTAPVTEKKEYIIPLISNNNWRAAHRSKKLKAIITENEQDVRYENEVILGISEVGPATADVPLTLDEIAKRELIAEGTSDDGPSGRQGSKDSSLAIPMVLRNAAPSGFETDDVLDVSTRAEDPTAEDYEKIPVEEFGLAMLRGMGWKPGEAVGGKMAKFVAPVEVTIRPKGLGLGAEVPVSKQKTAASSRSGKPEESLELKKGCHVMAEFGEFRGYYGTVEAFDEDLVRGTVRLVLTDMVVSVPLATLRVVTRDEFKKEGKVINRSTYDDYKNKKSDSKTKEQPRTSDRNGKDSRGHDKYDSKPSKHATSSRGSDSRGSGTSSSWIQPWLRVRLVDKQFRRGKYYKEKMIITEVLTPRSCVCKTDDRITLEDVRASMLETVVPHSDNSNVMILRGPHKNEIGQLLQRNKDKCVASVQLLSDRTIIIELDYDDICEYTGDSNY